MNLKDMTVAQLRKRADKLGVQYTDKTTREKLLARVRKARKLAMAAAAPETWPSDWPVEMHDAYFHAIVKEPMPDDSHDAYQQLKAAIDLQAPDVELVRTKVGISCFGLWYNPALKQCSIACHVMPLCKQVCATRPNLKDQVAEIEQAAQEMEATQAIRKTKRVGKKKADPEMVTYEWVGDVDDYEADPGDEEAETNLEVYRWMAGPTDKGQPHIFAVDDLAKRLAEHYEEDGCMEVAQQMIDFLLNEGDIKPAGISARAISA